MPARNILVINCGSSSLKFALINEVQDAFILSGLAEALDSLQGIGDPAPWIPESLPLATRTLITGLLDPRPDQRRWAPGAPAW